ncbi:hypothetical protein EDC04DRAFT_2565243 [Pisolithus marmoratus]|nr:hypothetical protein EDC04DRAFT_2565243 [Pisolithus marmoratus]
MDWPNIRISICKIKYPLASYANLSFLVPEGWTAGHPAAKTLTPLCFPRTLFPRSSVPQHLPQEVHHRIKWFNVDMMTTYKEAEVTNLHAGDTWGLCTMESFGMGMDVPDIAIVVQWRVTCGLSMLWQCWGCAGRVHGKSGMAILFTEKDLFNDVKEENRI